MPDCFRLHRVTRCRGHANEQHLAEQFAPVGPPVVKQFGSFVSFALKLAPRRSTSGRATDLVRL